MSNGNIASLPSDIDKLNDLLEKIPEGKKPIAESLYSELEFMQRTLKKLKDQIDAEGSTQGDLGSRKEHPAVKSYTSLIHRYAGMLDQFEKLLPKVVEPKPKDPLMDFIK